jgi:hypothetical protein
MATLSAPPETARIAFDSHQVRAGHALLRTVSSGGTIGVDMERAKTAGESIKSVEF